MPDKTKLNPELAELEELLLNSVVPECQLNRDELMYRSGWEAALASSKSSDRFSLPNQKAGRHWLLPTISVLSSAAAILFGIMLLNQSQNDGGAELVVAKTNAPAGVGIAKPVSTKNAEVLSDEFVEVPDLLRLVMELPCDKTLHAGMVVGPNFSIGSEPSLASPIAPTSKESSRPMTQQELMDELLPNRFNRSPKWSFFPMGGNS